ncbi:MAG: 2-phospho-L-lactate transferase [Candidatus Bathyarchaeia archaeon]|jgi:LPPG:FO 2-phospho-L-lactate transferase
MIVSLAGGVGAAKFLEGLIRVVPQRELTVIGNVGDDMEIYGLHISPDLDIVAYTLAGLVDKDKGWGIRNDTFAFLSALRRYGYETWFNIGDRDLATHTFRTEQLRKGRSLLEATATIVNRLGLRITLLPATNDDFQTYMTIHGNQIHFQEYMVKLQTKPRVQRITFRGAKSAKPADGVIRSIQQARGIIISPSNPIVSIGAILNVPRIRNALDNAASKIVAISPIVRGKTIKGPAAKLMKALCLEPTAVGVAEIYRDFLDTLILDKQDKHLAKKVEDLGIKAVVTNTIMATLEDKIKLARTVMREFS